MIPKAANGALRGGRLPVWHPSLYLYTFREANFGSTTAQARWTAHDRPRRLRQDSV